MVRDCQLPLVEGGVKPNSTVDPSVYKLVENEKISSSAVLNSVMASTRLRITRRIFAIEAAKLENDERRGVV